MVDPQIIKLCECGCDKPTPVAKKTRPQWGHIKGAQVRFIRGHHARLQPKGYKAYRWIDGRTHDSNGYIMVRAEGHPRAKSPGQYVYEHILIAEAAAGIMLPEPIEVHHVNEKKSDNSHGKRSNALIASGHANWRKCPYCKQYDDPLAMHKRTTSNLHYHLECDKKRQQQFRNQNNQTKGE